jgi:hypothetical protein
MEHGHHVLGACGKNAVLRMYEKFSTFLRLEVLSNNLRDFGLNKSLENLESVRQTLAAVTDRFVEFEAHALDVHIDFPLFQRLALPLLSGSTKVPVSRSRTPACSALWKSFSIAVRNAAAGVPAGSMMPSSLPTNSPRRPTPSPSFATTCANSEPMPCSSVTAIAMPIALRQKAFELPVMFVLFHQRICGLLANSLFHRKPTQTHTPKELIRGDAAGRPLPVWFRP